MTKTQGESKEFEPHPVGAFIAVCRDIYIREEHNSFYGKVSKYTGKIDEKQTVTRIYFDFLTDESIEINGVMEPRFARYRANVSWHDDSNLRKFIKGWNPVIAKDDNADLQVFVGKGAYLTIAHNAGGDGKTYANVVGIAAPPKGSSIPEISKEFIRYKDRVENGGTGKPAVSDDDLPF